MERLDDKLKVSTMLAFLHYIACCVRQVLFSHLLKMRCEAKV